MRAKLTPYKLRCSQSIIADMPYQNTEFGGKAMHISLLNCEFGICQLGQCPEFDPIHVDSARKNIIDISKPVLELIQDIADLNMMFIVSQFCNVEEISHALELVKICRNYPVFISVIAASGNTQRTDLLNLKDEVDIFLTLDENPFPDDSQLDSVAYAIDFLAESFDMELYEFESEPFYSGSVYAFSKSGNAELLTFELHKADYNQGQLQLKDEVVARISGKRLAFVHFKSGEDSRMWPTNYITNIIKATAGNMIYTTWRGSFDEAIGKRAFVTVLLSNLDNPNNSYGNGKNKTVFQKRIC